MKVKDMRILRGIKQKELAKLVGVSIATMGRIERGDIDNTKFITLRKVSEILGASIEDLFLSDEN